MEYNKHYWRETSCRPDLSEILEKLYNSQAKIALITNCSLLAKCLDICRWLEKITVSVHSTDNVKYQQIIETPFEFSSLVNNHKLVRKNYPQANIRFNCTIVRGVNSTEDDILDIIRLAKELGASIKFIELLPNSKEDEDKFVSIDEIEHILLKHNYILIENGLLQKIYFDEESVIVLAKIVCSVSKHLGTASPHCTTTNNVFLAADGTIKPCMRNSFEINVFDEIKIEILLVSKKR